MTRYANRKLKYSVNENFNFLPYVEWDRFVTLTGERNEGYVIVSNPNSPLVVSEVRVARSLVFCVVFCRSLFARFSFFFLSIVLCPSSIYGF